MTTYTHDFKHATMDAMVRMNCETGHFTIMGDDGNEVADGELQDMFDRQDAIGWRLTALNGMPVVVG